MKYIVFRGASTNLETIITFPRFITHHTFSVNVKLFLGDPISAGFVSPDNNCYGKSISLGLKSRKDMDTRLLERELNETS